MDGICFYSSTQFSNFNRVLTLLEFLIPALENIHFVCTCGTLALDGVSCPKISLQGGKTERCC